MLSVVLWFALLQSIRADCESEQWRRFLVVLGSNGGGLCAVSPDPIKVLGPTQHLGECLAACVNQTDCFSYTYHFDSKTCDLACFPTEYATVDNCLSYLRTDVVKTCSASNPCLHGGSCVDTCHNFTCLCLPGVSGRICELDVLNECDSNPCKNNGVCVNGFSSFECLCTPLHFSGLTCAVPNLALGKPAYQSSTYCSYSTAPNAVDGNDDGMFNDGSCATNTDGAGGPNWLVVDLGYPVKIDHVVVTNRTDGWETRLDNFIVGLTTSFDSVSDPPVRGSYNLCGQYPGAAGLGARLTVTCSPDVIEARYVIIQQPASGLGTMTVCELEVYGR